jgi:hypothetical protein
MAGMPKYWTRDYILLAIYLPLNTTIKKGNLVYTLLVSLIVSYLTSPNTSNNLWDHDLIETHDNSWYAVFFVYDNLRNIPSYPSP